MGEPATKPPTETEPFAQPMSVEEFIPLIANQEPLELIEGQVVRKAAPQRRHGSAQQKISALLDGYSRRPGGPRGPGGWWLMTEVDTLYAKTKEVFRHDVQGYLRELHAEPPEGFPVPHVPQWACEILSPSNARIDWIKKQHTLHVHAVPHYWIVDPQNELLTVLRYHEEGYRLVLTAGRGDVVKAEPFDAVEISVDELFGYT